MNFDPAIVAWQAFSRVRVSSELGDDLAAAVAAHERLTEGSAEEASEAYRELVAIGDRNPAAATYLEFLVYTTWCYLMDETAAEHFRRGATLCRVLLRRGEPGDPEGVARLQAMEQSFLAGLGDVAADDGLDFDRDTLKGGD